MPFLAAIPAALGIGAAAAGTAAGTAAATAPGWVTALGLAGTAVSTVGAVVGAGQQAAGLQAQGKAAEYNEKVAQQNAEAVRTAGAYQEQLMRQHNARIQGTARANYAASGVTMEGSPIDVLASNAANMEQDVLAKRYNTGVEAGRYESQAGFYGLEAERDQDMADSTSSMGWLKAGTTLLGGAYDMFKPAPMRPSFN